MPTMWLWNPPQRRLIWSLEEKHRIVKLYNRIASTSSVWITKQYSPFEKGKWMNFRSNIKPPWKLIVWIAFISSKKKEKKKERRRRMFIKLKIQFWNFFQLSMVEHQTWIIMFRPNDNVWSSCCWSNECFNFIVGVCRVNTIGNIHDGIMFQRWSDRNILKTLHNFVFKRPKIPYRYHIMTEKIKYVNYSQVLCLPQNASAVWRTGHKWRCRS